MNRPDWSRDVLLGEVSPGRFLGLYGVRVGQTVQEVVKLLGRPSSKYPRPGRKFDRELHEGLAFLRWKARGIDVAFGAIDDLGRTTRRSRVEAVHLKGRNVFIDVTRPRRPKRDDVRAEHGDPRETGEYTSSHGRRGLWLRMTWEFYPTGLQAIYDARGYLRSICVLRARKPRKARAS